MTLSRRILFLILVALIPTIALEVVNLVELRQSRTADVRQQALRLAELINTDLASILDGAKSLLASIAELRSVQESDVPACTRTVSKIRRHYPYLASIGVLDATGEMVCTSLLPVPTRDTIRGWHYIRDVRDAHAPGEISIGTFTTSNATGEPILPMALPFNDEAGKLKGFVFAALDLKWLSQHLAERQVPPLTAIAVVDRLGTVLARNADAARWIGARASESTLPYINADEPGVTDMPGIEGVQRIVGYIPTHILPHGLYVGAGLYAPNFMTDIDAATYRGILLILLVIGTAVAASLAGGSWFIGQPVRRMVAATQCWASGDFSTRLAADRSTSELNMLGSRLNRMAEALQERDRAVQESHLLLEGRVAERTAELAHANEKLGHEIEQRSHAEAALRQSQKMEAIGQLTGGVAHDFNNLLTVVIGNIEALQRHFPELAKGNHDFRRMTDAAMRGAERGALLTRRLLAFSRQQPLAPRPVNLNRLVSSMSDLLRSTLGESIRVEAVLSGGLWWVAADANQLENTILNLAVNARHAMPTGGKLTIETANAHLDEAYTESSPDLRPGQYAMIAISDTGCGMSRAVIERAFEPFFTTKEIGQGTGLGLSQVYGFVTQSGGHVKIYSEIDQGTTVRIYLPRIVHENEEKEAPPAPRHTTARQQSGTILVVEDDPDVRLYSGTVLRELGYRVIEAQDGRTALDILDTQEIDLLFTDVGLPGMTGKQLAEEARRRRPKLKILFGTGYARNAIVHQGRLDSHVELIVKPFTTHTLSEKVSRILAATDD